MAAAGRYLTGPVTVAALATCAAAIPTSSVAQPLTFRDRPIETELQEHLAQAREQAGAAVTALRQAPTLPSPALDALLTTLDLVAADSLLIRARQRDVARRLERNAAPASAVTRHASSIAALNRDLDDLLRAAESARQASAGGDLAALLAALDALVSRLEQQQQRADRTPLSATLPHRPLRLPAVEPSSAPAIVPAYQSKDSVAPAAGDFASSGDVLIDAVIKAQARTLNQNPIRIFEFVRNEIRTEFYYGAMKGAGETLRQKSGNDADQAALLLALMRASGIGGRYVRGVISLAAAQAQAWTGVSSARRVADVLTRAGVPFRAVRQGGVIGAFEIEHIWTEVFVPYSNYRGEPLDPAGRAWIPLDASFKPTLHTAGIDLLGEMQFTADRLVSEYLTAPQTLTPSAFYRKQITDYLTAGRPELSYEQVTGTFATQTSSFGLLPSTLPYQTFAVRYEGAELPDELRHRLRFVAGPGTAPAFDITVAASEILGRRLTLSYVPATVEDQITAGAFLGLDSTPAYLVHVRPVLKSAGVIRAAGETVMQMGDAHRFRIEIHTPRGVVPFENDLVAGGYYAIAFGSRDAVYQPPAARAPEDTERAAAELLFRQAADYLDDWNETEATLERILRVVNVRPALAQVMVGNVYNRTLLFGQPQSLAWRGVFVDADLRISEPVPVGADDGRAREFMRLSGLAGSMAEGEVLQRNLRADAVSAARLLQLAAAGGIPIDTIDAANVEAALARLSTAEIVKQEIRDGVNQGWQAIVPRRDFTRNAWTGIGYLLLDPATGAGGYFISGGLAGGMTSQSPQDWVDQQLANELESPYHDLPNTDPNAAASIQKVTITDGQEGTAGERAPRSIAVWVRDEDGLPVRGARVTFRVTQGSGDFDGAETVSVLTDNLGVAEASPRLGKSTYVFPFFVKRSPADQFVTQVGQNIITASVPSPGGDVHLEAPFQLFSLPGPAHHNRKVLGDNTLATAGAGAGSLLARVEDQYDNPISNADVLFKVGPATALTGTLPADAANMVLYPAEPPCPVRTPLLGDCNGVAELKARTTFLGAAVQTILGNTVGTKYQVVASVPGNAVPEQTFTLTSDGIFDYTSDTYHTPWLTMVRLELVTDKKELLNAAKAGTQLPKPLEVLVYLIEDNYSIVPTNDPTCGFEPPAPPCYRAQSARTQRIRPIGGTSGLFSYPNLVGGPTFLPAEAQSANVTFTPTQGGGSTLQTEVLPSGRYAARVMVGSEPAQNTFTVDATAQVWVPCFNLYAGLVEGKLLSLKPGQFLTPDSFRCAGPDRQPVAGGSPYTVQHQVFGVKAAVDDKILSVGQTGATLADEDLSYAINPAGYSAQIADVDLFKVATDGTDEWIGYLVGLQTAGQGVARVFKGTGFDVSRPHRTQLVLNRGSEVDIRSDKADLVLVPPALLTAGCAGGAGAGGDGAAGAVGGPECTVTTYLDRINQEICAAVGVLPLSLSRTARVTITVDGNILTVMTPSGPVTYQDLELTEGDHNITITPSVVPLPGEHNFLVTGVFRHAGVPDVTVTAAGKILHDVVINAFLPVGHTMIKGVDLQNGQFALSREDFSFGGHGPTLEFSRSYGSAGSSASGPMGAGWRHAYDSRLIQDPCGTITVVGGEGSGIRFSSPTSGQDAQGNPIATFRPQVGYHGSLVYRTQEDSYDYYTKTRMRFHFARAPGAQGERPYRLAFMEDTHGNRLTLTYDAQPPHDLKIVTDAAGRTLTFTYQPFGIVAQLRLEGLTVPENRIVKIEGPLGLLVTFEYDTYGNLTKAARGERVEKYDYTVANARDRHNLVRIVGPNNGTTGAGFDVTAITYYADADPFLGASHCGGNNPFLPDRCQFVKTFGEGAGTASQALHQFTYDYSQAQTAIVTTVVDPRDVRTRYTMHPQFGTVLEERVLLASGDNVKQMRWAFQDGINDVYVTRMTDPNGRVTNYTYDANGNLIREAVQTSGPAGYDPATDSRGVDVGEVVTSYEYDPVSNRLRKRTDPEGNVTEYGLDPATGEVLSVTADPKDGSGPIVVTYTYGSHGSLRGLLMSTTDPRQVVTRYTAFDAQGQPTQIVDGAGNVTTNRYDVRGRLAESHDGFGRHVIYSYDDLDRLFSVGKKPTHQPLDFEMATPDQVVLTTYFPGGQTRTVTDGLGHVARHTYDALNRLTGTRDDLVDADGAAYALQWQATYDGNGNRTGEVDRRGITHELTYDPLNRLSEERVGGQRIAAITYDAAGNRLMETDLHGHVTAHGYNRLYQRTREILPLAPFARTKRYDLAGNVLSFTDANGRETRRAYDGVYRLRSETSPVGVTTSYRYDAAGNITSIETGTGLTTRFESYDGLNRPGRTSRQFVDSLTAQLVTYTATYTYSDAQHLLEVRNARGFLSRERRNGLNQVIEQVVDADGLALRRQFRYDGNGNLTAAKDSEGPAVDAEHEYDGLNRRIRTTLPLGDRERVFYDGGGNIVRTIDRRGITTRFEYDHLGRKLREILAESVTNGGADLLRAEAEYDDQTNTIRSRDANRNLTTIQHDALHREVVLTDALSQTRRFEWDGENKLAEIDKRGIRTEFAYDAVNRLVLRRRIAADGAENSSSIRYQDAQNRRVDVDARGVETITQMDALQRERRVSARHPSLSALYSAEEIVLGETEYDGNGLVRLSKDANGNATAFEYDAADRLTARIDAPGTPYEATTRYTHDGADNLLTTKDGRAHEGRFDARYTYDYRNRLAREENGAGEATLFTYDPNDNLRTVQEAKGGVHATVYHYDELNQLVAVDETRGGAGGIMFFQYDANRNRIAQQDADGSLTTYRYDALNRLIDIFQHVAAGSLSLQSRRSDAPGGDMITARRWQNQYDANSNRTLVVDPEGQRVAFSYDYLNRLARKEYANDVQGPGGAPVYPRPSSVAFQYDTVGNLTRVEEIKEISAGTTATEVGTIEHDALGRITLKMNHDGKTLRYAYDRAGNRTAVIDADGVPTSYQFDARNRLRAVDTEFGSGRGTTQYEYWPDNLKRRVSYPNGSAAMLSYDSADRLLSLVNAGADPTNPISRFDYSYDANGNRISQQERHSRLSAGATLETTYRFDTLDRLTGVMYGSAEIAYTLARNGNRLSEVGVNPRSLAPIDRQYTYDRLNQVTAITDRVDPAASILFSYDRNGNTVRQRIGTIDPASGDIPAPVLVKEWAFNIRDQLTRTEHTGAPVVTFDYDYAGNRVKMNTPLFSIRYLHDGPAVLQEYEPGSGATRLKYNYGAGLLSLVQAASTRNSLFYLGDAVGSTSELTDESGAVQASFAYDIWGGTRDSFNLTPNRRGFLGHYADQETGLQFFGARYYDPSIGRFVSPDAFSGEASIPASLHSYQYANANPTVYVDLDGYASVANCNDEISFRCTARDVSKFLRGGAGAIGRGLFKAGYETLATVYDLEQVALASARSVITPIFVPGYEPKPIEFTSAIGQAADQGMGTLDMLNGMATNIVKVPVEAVVNTGKAMASGDSAQMGEAFGNLELVLGSFLSPKGKVRPGRSTIAELGDVAAHKNIRPGAPRARSAASTIAQTEIEAHLADMGEHLRRRETLAVHRQAQIIRETLQPPPAQPWGLGSTETVFRGRGMSQTELQTLLATGVVESPARHTFGAGSDGVVEMLYESRAIEWQRGLTDYRRNLRGRELLQALHVGGSGRDSPGISFAKQRDIAEDFAITSAQKNPAVRRPYLIVAEVPTNQGYRLRGGGDSGYIGEFEVTYFHEVRPVRMEVYELIYQTMPGRRAMPVNPVDPRRRPGVNPAPDTQAIIGYRRIGEFRMR